MKNRRIVTFAVNTKEPFKLVIEAYGNRARYLKFLHGDRIVPELGPQPLRVLEYLVDRKDRVCERTEILDAIAPDKSFNLIDQYISEILKAIRNVDETCPKFIKTIRNVGYQLDVDLTDEGDLGSVEAYSQWNRTRVRELLDDVTRGSGPDGDIRITATGLGPAVEYINFKELLKRRLRIKILFMNPRNEPLIDSRFLLRSEREDSYARCISEQVTQINDVRVFARDYPPADPEKREKPNYRLGPGEFEFALSDAMPCGFVIHTLNWALVGLFLAHASYSEGPMLDIQSRSEAWMQLKADWDARWRAAKANRSKWISRNADENMTA
jgi:DNA-binding winged helix-turn-helix (wHTH) protein